MKTIYRIRVNSAINDVMLPIGAEILSAGVATDPGIGESVCIWALVDTEAEPVERRILVYGTGADMSEMCDSNVCDYRFIGTVRRADRYAFHVFEATYRK